MTFVVTSMATHRHTSCARCLSRERALGAALRSGADNPQVTVEELTDGLDTYRVRAKAVGNPRLTR